MTPVVLQVAHLLVIHAVLTEQSRVLTEIHAAPTVVRRMDTFVAKGRTFRVSRDRLVVPRASESLKSFEFIIC